MKDYNRIKSCKKNVRILLKLVLDLEARVTVKFFFFCKSKILKQVNIVSIDDLPKVLAD